ncbi:Hypothetical predicted protein, partial [Pelobates cultripes]
MDPLPSAVALLQVDVQQLPVRAPTSGYITEPSSDLTSGIAPVRARCPSRRDSVLRLAAGSDRSSSQRCCKARPGYASLLRPPAAISSSPHRAWRQAHWCPGAPGPPTAIHGHRCLPGTLGSARSTVTLHTGQHIIQGARTVCGSVSLQEGHKILARNIHGNQVLGDFHLDAQKCGSKNYR